MAGGQVAAVDTGAAHQDHGKFKRWLFHTFMPPWRSLVSFPAAVLKDIEMAVKQSERQHRGELCFAIENTLAPTWAEVVPKIKHRAIKTLGTKP